ncbi:MAG: ATPase, T2SS/T4P/T4SS family [Candidatus Bathyarchaeia archaeon]
MPKFIVDLSALRNGFIRKLALEEMPDSEVLIPDIVLRKIRERFLSGDKWLLQNLEESVKLLRERGISLNILPVQSETPEALIGEALRIDATIVTCDLALASIAEALNVKCMYMPPSSKLKLEDFFKENVMSVHLKEGVQPRLKRGTPGNWRFETLEEVILSREDLEALVEGFMDRVRSGEAYLEIDRDGSKIFQMGPYRIVVTYPPFSDGLEITAVKPIVKLTLKDYKLPSKLVSRLETQAEGILIAGAPGMGKSTFAQALAEYYLSLGKIVKTIESPRDLQLPEAITQYSKNVSNPDEIYDVLLLSRPDYTVFDEMRGTNDFKLYADLRLAGVGMIGVVHATSPIDAIQRFVGRVELGMIPSIIDTVIFLENGIVTKVYSLETIVKIPHGLRDSDLARPVVQVKDYLTGEVEYEIYVFGERTFVVPIKRREVSETSSILENVLNRYVDRCRVEIQGDEAVIYVDEDEVGKLTRKCLRRLERAGRRMGITNFRIEAMRD